MYVLAQDSDQNTEVFGNFLWKAVEGEPLAHHAQIREAILFLFEKAANCFHGPMEMYTAKMEKRGCSEIFFVVEQDQYLHIPNPPSFFDNYCGYGCKEIGLRQQKPLQRNFTINIAMVKETVHHLTCAMQNQIVLKTSDLDLPSFVVYILSRLHCIECRRLRMNFHFSSLPHTLIYKCGTLHTY